MTKNLRQHSATNDRERPIHTSPLWPSESDALLLRAVLLDGDEAIDAWRAWASRTDYTNLDFAQRRLIPLLHSKLKGLAISDPLMARYATETRGFWIRNQALFRFALEEVDRLERRGTKVIVMKGVALAHRYYPSNGLRPMSDVDILVEAANAADTLASFVERGWICSDDAILTLDDLAQIVAVRNCVNMREPASGREIDVHWQIQKHCLTDMKPVWAASEPFMLGDRELRAMCPTDQLLHACAQAADWNVVRPIRWMADAAMILDRAEIDWDRLIAMAQHFELVQAVREALRVLQEFLGLELPETPIERLHAMQPSLIERLDYRTSASAPVTMIGRPFVRYLRYRRIGKPQRLSFAAYLRHMWGTSSLTRAFAQGCRLLWVDTIRRVRK